MNGKKPGPPVHDDLCTVTDEKGRLRHEFTAEAPNQLRLTDVTEHKTAEGKLYCCAVKDVFSNKIAGYSIDSRMKSRLAVGALENAIAMRGDVAGCMVHSDWLNSPNSAPTPFVRVLKNNVITGSMSRVGGFGDNAAMESFFALLQKNVLDGQRWATWEELRLAIVVWIERTHHRRRRQRRLGKLTPIEFEPINMALKAA